MRIKREVFLDKISSNYPILVSKFNDSPICDVIRVVVESEHSYKSESLLYSLAIFENISFWVWV